MGFDLSPLLAAYSTGNQINANLAATQADSALKMQSLAQGQQNMAIQAQQQQAKLEAQQQVAKMLQNQDAVNQSNQVSAGKSPDMEAEGQLTQSIGNYRKMAQAYLVADPQTAENYSKMADAAEGRLGTLRTQNLAIAQKKIGNAASYAGAVLSGQQTPDQAFQWAKDNLGLDEAMKIPTDPAAATLYWKAKQTQGLSAQEQMQNTLQEQQAKDKRDAAAQASKDREEAEKDRAADAAARRDFANTVHADAVTAHADAAAARVESTHFQQTEKLNTNLQRTAKPFLDDKQRLDEVGGLLQQGTPEADQQAHQALTSLLGNFKGRATSQFYKDNANFGSLAGRLTGALAHGFSGQYKDSDRQGLLAMVNQMRSNVVEPTLNNLELQTKQRAAGYKLNPDEVQIAGDFQRSTTPTNLGNATGKTYSPAGAPTPAPAAAPTPAPVANAAPAPAPVSYAEGQTATGPNGHRIVFHQGKWISQ